MWTLIRSIGTYAKPQYASSGLSAAASSLAATPAADLPVPLRSESPTRLESLELTL
jgi:hypothetical protein